LDFLLDVLKGIIGPLLGFQLGLVAFRRQQKHHDQVQDKKRKQGALEAVGRLDVAARLNIETIATLKGWFLLQVLPEAKATREAMSKPSSELSSLLGSHKYFFAHTLSVRVKSVPSETEYARVSIEMPKLRELVYHAMFQSENLSELVAQRNRWVELLKKESTVNLSQLSQAVLTTVAMEQVTNDAIYFWMLTRKQTGYYIDRVALDAPFKQMPLTERATTLLPREDMHPQKLDGLRTFENV
jgi:hypothetical protein